MTPIDISGVGASGQKQGEMTHDDTPVRWPDAACNGKPTDWFYPLGYGHDDEHITEMNRLALECCDQCPRRTECRERALAMVDCYGTWGGHTEPELHQMRVARYGGGQ